MRTLTAEMSNGLVIDVKGVDKFFVVHSEEPFAEKQFNHQALDENEIVLLVNDQNEVIQHRAKFEYEIRVEADDEDPRFWKLASLPVS